MEIILPLLIGIISLMIIPALLGLMMLYHTLIRNKKFPADKSNRINHIRLVWFALSREDLFVNTFEWLKRDELENIKN
jgi:hypothetical protein